MSEPSTRERRRRHIELACLLEATARKPGNVHPGREFDSLTYLELVRSGVAVGPVLADIEPGSFGKTVLQAVRATRQVADTNTNLGILLLLAPLCLVDPRDYKPETMIEKLDALTVEDSRYVYQAIREAEPGGLGEVKDQDVRSEPSLPLRQVMVLAADRDSIARQYTNGFADVFAIGAPALAQAFERGCGVEEAIVRCHLQWISKFPDSLIARKRGIAEAEQAARWADAVLQSPLPVFENPEWKALDDWLTAEGNARNPGTSADLVAASLFCAMELSQFPRTYFAPRSGGQANFETVR